MERLSRSRAQARPAATHTALVKTEATATAPVARASVASFNGLARQTYQLERQTKAKAAAIGYAIAADSASVKVPERSINHATKDAIGNQAARYHRSRRLLLSMGCTLVSS